MDYIDHFAINVSDIEQAVNWWTTSFNCECVSMEKNFACLRFANVEIHLVLPSLHLSHLAIIRSDADSFGEIRNQPLGRASTEISDSSGNIVELIKPTTAQNHSE